MSAQSPNPNKLVSAYRDIQALQGLVEALTNRVMALEVWKATEDRKNMPGVTIVDRSQVQTR